MKMRTNNILLVAIGVNILLLLGFSAIFIREGAEANEEVELPRCVPYDVKTIAIREENVTIQWKTNGDCVSYLQYNEFASDTSKISGDSWAPSVDHESYVDGLERGKVYQFYIISDGKLYDDSGEAIIVETPSF
ncbi:MAG: hypothetical protein QY318_01760 [Candidatus Dojkabacteria bacterium]|nr:MAG: hypothetical protein QY318_01760 [Candidatus Dojkabacteria bacterium]